MAPTEKGKRKGGVDTILAVSRLKGTTQPVFFCSKLTIEKLEQAVNIFHNLLVFLLLTLNI